jgi:large subunit ribosomal protein L23
VKVGKVATVNVGGKNKRLGRFEGPRSDWKKAVVTLQEGFKIDFFEGK